MSELKPLIESAVEQYDQEQHEISLRLQRQEEQRQRYQQPDDFDDFYNYQNITDQDHDTNLQSIRNLQRIYHQSYSADHVNPNTNSQSTTSFAYPQAQYESSFNSPSSSSSQTNGIPPILPSKPVSLKPEISDVLSPFNTVNTYSAPPPLPSKPNIDQKPNVPVSSASGVSTEFKTKNRTEGGMPLRTIFLPDGLRSKFLEIALPNTVKNLETCGMLCGKLQNNAFFITRLAIPHQISTSDTCSTTHEEILFEYLDENDLFMLGWIHTHPTQSCFLSSVDLHTQNSYQIMLPESIAIVCSPKHDPSWGIFRLTDPSGINIIKACPKTGFHPHPEPNLYKSAHNPGHIMLRTDIPFSVEDLRLREPTS